MRPRSMRWDKLFCQYGHFLTHLNFNCVKVTRWQLKEALIYTPNLQALSINLINSFRGIEATKLKNCDADKIIISPNLATLQIIEDCQIQLADWILRLCAHQLVNLSITTQNHQFLDYVFRRKFVKLKQLRIHFSHFCEIWHGVSHPESEYLSIDMLFYLCDDIHYKIYMDFIGQFSSTLVHLGLSWHAVSRGYFGYLKEKGILFPKIRSLTLRNHSYNVSWEGTQAKRDAEVLFPNVRDVKIVDVEYGYAPRNLI
ncbi:unnamed protein product [Orchesella dallaii]|uniref:Uncharacterized protein n=1 Tax=Orchesella dallaii TaxID=48710 RepID=A0ABP1RW45_9HEXA